MKAKFPPRYKLFDAAFVVGPTLSLIYTDTMFGKHQEPFKNWSPFAEDCVVIRLTGGFVEY